MSITIILNKKDMQRIHHAAQLNVDKFVKFGESVHPENYSKEEYRIVQCVITKHRADIVSFPDLW